MTRRRGAPALYVQVADTLRRRIGADLEPGARLPSEPTLAEAFAVSRATVIKALDLLERERLVTREQGRGTFARSPRLARRLPELTGFTEHVTSIGHRAGQRLLDVRPAVAEPGDPLLAAFPEHEDLLVLRRLRLVDDRPAGVHRTAVPAWVARRVGVPERLRGRQASLYALFAEHGVIVAAASEHLRARLAGREDAAALEVAEGAALIHVRRFSRDDGGRLVEAVDAHYLGDLYDYRIDLIRTRPGQRQEQHDDAIEDPSLAGGLRLAGDGLRD